MSSFLPPAVASQHPSFLNLREQDVSDGERDGNAGFGAEINDDVANDSKGMGEDEGG